MMLVIETWALLCFLFSYQIFCCFLKLLLKYSYKLFVDAYVFVCVWGAIKQFKNNLLHLKEIVVKYMLVFWSFTWLFSLIKAEFLTRVIRKKCTHLKNCLFPTINLWNIGQQNYNTQLPFYAGRYIIQLLIV